MIDKKHKKYILNRSKQYDIISLTREAAILSTELFEEPQQCKNLLDAVPLAFPAMVMDRLDELKIRFSIDEFKYCFMDY